MSVRHKEKKKYVAMVIRKKVTGKKSQKKSRKNEKNIEIFHLKSAVVNKFGVHYNLFITWLVITWFLI